MPIHFRLKKLSNKIDVQFELKSFDSTVLHSAEDYPHSSMIRGLFDTCLKAKVGSYGIYNYARYDDESEEVLWYSLRHLFFSTARLCVFKLKDVGYMRPEWCENLAKYLGVMPHLKETQFFISNKSQGAVILLQHLLTDNHFLQLCPWLLLRHDYDGIVEARLL